MNKLRFCLTGSQRDKQALGVVLKHSWGHCCPLLHLTHDKKKSFPLPFAFLQQRKQNRLLAHLWWWQWYKHNTFEKFTVPTRKAGMKCFCVFHFWFGRGSVATNVTPSWIISEYVWKYRILGHACCHRSTEQSCHVCRSCNLSVFSCKVVLTLNATLT